MKITDEAKAQIMEALNSNGCDSLQANRKGDLV